jgi:hypothetical protein
MFGSATGKLPQFDAMADWKLGMARKFTAVLQNVRARCRLLTRMAERTKDY